MFAISASTFRPSCNTTTSAASAIHPFIATPGRTVSDGLTSPIRPISVR